MAKVKLKGKYYAKAALDKIRSDVAATYEATPIKPFGAVIDTSHVD